MWLHTVGYRLRQVRQQLGFVAPLSEEDYQQVASVLPSSAALALFRSMSPADQQHALRVCHGLQARGCTDTDMLAAALLHDIGKAHNRVPFWTRPAIVLGKKLAPQLLSRLVIHPTPIPKWRQSLSNAWYHADIGADLAASTGLSERAVLYIRTHHQPGGPAPALHAIDEVS